MDPAGPWPAYPAYNRLAAVQPAPASSAALHHHLGTGAAPPVVVTTPAASSTTSAPAHIVHGGFLSPPPVGYETVFNPLFHHAASVKAPPATHYVAQHRQVLAAAGTTKSSEPGGPPEYHHPPAQVFFDQNPAAAAAAAAAAAGPWPQNSPFGILPHESVVPATTAPANYNTNFATSTHVNLLAVKGATTTCTTNPQVVNTPKANPAFFHIAYTTTPSSSPGSKPYVTTASQSCIVMSTATPSPDKDYRSGQSNAQRAIYIPPPSTTNVPLAEKSFTPVPTKQPKREEQPNGPVSFSVLDTQRVYTTNSVANNGSKRTFQTNYRHYSQTAPDPSSDAKRNKDFGNASNGSECATNATVPRRPSPLQAHSQASPIGQAQSPAYPLYNSPMATSALSSPQGSTNQMTPPSPLDVSVPRPSSQSNQVAYSSVITRTEKSFPERYERKCWEDRRNFGNNYTAGNVEISSARQMDAIRSDPNERLQANPPNITDRQQTYYEANHQVALQDLSSCRGDPMSLVKNLHQQGCQIASADVKQGNKANSRRRKSSETEASGRVPPPAHTPAANQQMQNGAYFDFDRWNLPPPPTKIFATQPIPQHQNLMHPHHPPPPLPYFTPFHLAPHPPEFQQSEAGPLQNFNENLQQPPVAQQQFQEEPAEDQPKVVVPNIEEELNFLSSSNPPRINKPPQIQQSKIINPPNVAKPAEIKKTGQGASFMNSYLKFLQGERDPSPPPVIRQSINPAWASGNDSGADSNGVSTARPAPVSTSRLSQGDPQDDPRYFPLPKERKNDLFNSSDDGISSDDDLFSKKVAPVAVKEAPPKDKPVKKGRPCKPGGPTERKRAKLLLKQKKEAEMKAKRGEESENVPRRETSKRAAKPKGSMALREVDQELPDFADSDSDPAWTPAAKAVPDEEIPLKKTKRGRGRRRGSARNVAHDATTRNHRNSNKGQRLALTLEDNLAKAASRQNLLINSTTSSDKKFPFKPGEFLIDKSDLKQDSPVIWRLDQKSLLQRFELFEQNGRTLYKNVSSYAALDSNGDKYLPVPVRYHSQIRSETIVEFLKHDMLHFDAELVESLLKETVVHQDNFEVYIQTLISQALDSNFLMEILQEKDDYFLSNVKVIDDVTLGKKQKLIGMLQWPPIVIAAVSTWPLYNILNESSSNSEEIVLEECAACSASCVCVRMLMYGQPYNATTLAGCPPDEKAINDKDFLMCRMCANKVEVLNKVCHQKYLMYIECAKRVADKRITDPQKDTTCILNELLADESWLVQLFKGVRMPWVQVECFETIRRKHQR